MSQKTSNKKARDLVTNRIEFTGSNTFGTLFPNGVYAVFSYGFHFPLFVFDGKVWIENADRYSVTTSKHKSQLRPDVGEQGSCFKLGTADLKSICGL